MLEAFLATVAREWAMFAAGWAVGGPTFLTIVVPFVLLVIAAELGARRFREKQRSGCAHCMLDAVKAAGGDQWCIANDQEALAILDRLADERALREGAGPHDPAGTDGSQGSP